MIYEGKDNGEISQALFISKSTLDKHLYHLYRKTGVKSRIQLLYLANQSGESCT